MNENDFQNIEAKDLYNMTFEEIDEIQNALNAHNLETIEKAFRQHRINYSERDYLLEFFHDGMGVEREVYRTLYETFGQPERTCSYDPVTGKVDTDKNGQKINYGLKVVTPFVNTRLEYRDKNINQIFVIMPKMKKASRAIEKIESEYGIEYQQEYTQMLNRLFRDEDRDSFCEAIQDIPQTTNSLHDILRLTITCKYLTDVQRIKRKLVENKSASFYIEPNEIRDRFNKPLSQNEKKYYDIKLIIHHKMPNGKILDVEAQLKINTLYQGDILTHGIYEDIRETEALLAKKRAQMDESEIRQNEAKIKILNNRIAQINKAFIHQYNMIVLDKAYRIENDGYRPLRVEPENADGTYNRCRSFINAEYMPESYQPFNGKEDFSAASDLNKLCYLRLIGKLPADFDMFADTASKHINYKFSRLSSAEIERFNGINEIAIRYEKVVQRKINDRAKSDHPVAYAGLANAKSNRSL